MSLTEQIAANLLLLFLQWSWKKKHAEKWRLWVDFSGRSGINYKGFLWEAFVEKAIKNRKLWLSIMSLIEGFTLFCVHVTLSAVCKKKIRHHAVGGQIALLWSHLIRVSISLCQKNLIESPTVKKNQKYAVRFYNCGRSKSSCVDKRYVWIQAKESRKEISEGVGYHNLNGTAASAFRSSKDEQTRWRRLRMKTRKPCVERCEDELTPNISTTVVSGKTLKCQFLNICFLFVIPANGNQACVNTTVS